MFSENLKALRKQKGLSQEMLAMQLNVVRQTVSKWEKGLSIPDADMLVRLAEILEVPVSQLLGGSIEDTTGQDTLAERLAQITEQLAVKNRRAKKIWRWIVGIALTVLAAVVLIFILNFAAYSKLNSQLNSPVIVNGFDGAEVVNTYNELKTYYELNDGTWLCDGYVYKYRLEVEGQLRGNTPRSTYTYLSNLKEITFDQAWKASGLSSNSTDYFSPEEAVLVGWASEQKED